MTEDGKRYIDAIGSLLTHIYCGGYQFSKDELAKIDKAIDLLFEVKEV